MIPASALAASTTIRPNALAALEHYKQKDMSKGISQPFIPVDPVSPMGPSSPHPISSICQYSFLSTPGIVLTETVVVRFKSIGSAPIMKNNVFKVTAGNKYTTVVTFLRGQLGSKEGDPLVCPPSPNHNHMNLIAPTQKHSVRPCRQGRKTWGYKAISPNSGFKDDS